jgi:cupin fold WbuC family metalloprotein
MRRVESAEVVYAGEGMVTVDAATIASLIRDAAHNPRRRIRLCTHSNVDDAVHEMLIVHERSCYVRPHKHVGKSESFHVIEGTVDVVVFDDLGTIAEVISMGPYASHRPFFYRIAEPLYHTLLIRSDVLVFHETTGGPFQRNQTVFAPWSPDGNDGDEVARYVSALDAAVADRKLGQERRA